MEKRGSIIKAFEQTVIALLPDGSQDHKFHIRGLPNFVVIEPTVDSDEEVEFIEGGSEAKLIHVDISVTGGSSFSDYAGKPLFRTRRMAFLVSWPPLCSKLSIMPSHHSPPL